MSLALCAVLVASPRLRPLVAALGGAFAVAVGYSRWCSRGISRATCSRAISSPCSGRRWASLPCAAAAARWPERSGRGAALRVGEAITPSALAGSRRRRARARSPWLAPARTVAYAQAHTVFVVGAATIALLGGTLAAALAVALRR